jgi:shikimate kinase
METASPAPRARNVVLVGMPGAGKSTAGVLLAKRTARAFVDSDLVIQERAGAPLEAILRAQGLDGFRRLEETVVCGLRPEHAVIATGGSVVYGDLAMAHLARLGTIVFLDVPLRELALRLGDLDARGVVRAPGQDLAALLAERLPLYRRCADVVVPCAGLDHDGVVEHVLRALDGRE